MKPRFTTILSDIYVLTGKILKTLALPTCAEKQSPSEHSKAYPFAGIWGLALFPLFLPISMSAQTTIVVRRTPSEIVVGADSKVVSRSRTIDMFGRAQDTVTYSTSCKIIVVGNRALVASGYLVNDAGLDVVKTGRVALQGVASIDDAADSYRDAIQQPLRDSLEQLRRFDLESYRKSTRNPNGETKDISQVIFVAIENGITKLAARTFVATNDESAPVTLAPLNVNIPNKAYPPGLDITVLGGHHADIDKYVSDEPFWRRIGNIAGVRTLIDIMESTDPVDVGGPIDILRLSRKGAEWIQHKQECPDIEKPAPSPSPKPAKRRPRR